METTLQEMADKMEFWRRAYRKEHQKVLRLEGKTTKSKEPDYILVGGAKCYTGK